MSRPDDESRPVAGRRGVGRTGRRQDLHRRLGSTRGWPATAVQWAQRFDSPAPPGGLTLRASASPPSKTPTSLRRFSISKGGSGGGGMSITPSQSPWSRRKNSISLERWNVSTGCRVALQLGHSRGSVPQTWRMRSRQSGRIARAVTFGGGGMSGGFGEGCFSEVETVGVEAGRCIPRLLFE